MAEIGLTVDYQGIKLAGSGHLPETTPARDAVLLLHGFTGSRIEFAYLFVDIARRLAARGITVFRFDFAGCGESEGRFVDLSIADQASQTGVLLDELAARYPGLRWHVVGYSMGALAAAATGVNRPDLASVILVAPAGNLDEIVSRSLEQGTALANGNIDFIGLELNPQLQVEASAFDLDAYMELLEAPTLILHGGRDVVVPAAIGERAAALAQRGTFIALAEADHGFWLGAHRQQLAELVGEWVECGGRLSDAAVFAGRE